MKLSLVVLSEGKAEGQAIPITLSQFLIGRDPQCHLRPASPVISKRHCAVLVKGGKVFLRDFGSTNGTYVNDEPVKAERQLRHDDLLKIGPLLFRVQIEAGTPVDKPTPPPPQSRPAAVASDDDDVAAMLLSLQEESAVATSDEARPEQVPSGTTEMDIPVLPPEKPEEKAPAAKETASDQPAATTGQPPAKKDPPKKPPSGSSSSAAAALLQKLSSRKRS